MTHILHSTGSAACRAGFALVVTIALLAISSTAAAHPGHGVTPQGDSAAHYLLEPAHGLGVLAVLASVALCAVIIRSRRIAGHSQQ